MYIIKNALKNLGRNKGRNILLSIIIFTLILSTTVALVINTTTLGIIDDYKTRFGSEVTLSVDFDKLMAESKPSADGSIRFPEAPQISPEQYMSFADSEHLKTFRMDMQTGIVFKDLKAIDESKENGMLKGIGGGNEEYVTPKAKLLGFSSIDNLPDFADGLRKIIDGEIYKNNNECLISSDFAELNNLKVNDSFQINDTTSNNEVTLTVAGIYADATKATGDLPPGAVSFEGSFGNRRNEIFVNMDTMTENLNINELIVNAEYELKSPDLVQDFENEVRDKGLPSAYNVSTDEVSYNKIVAPVIGLSDISMTFMWVILIVGSLILLFITSMAIRERKYEIGVLRAMGLKKGKVAFMLVSETIMITILCLGIGLSVGRMISQPVADSLIAGQVEATDNSQNGEIQFSNGAVSLGELESDVEPLSDIDVSMTSEAVIQIVLIALGLALLSSAAGVIFITKYEPMKILSDRN